MNWVEFGDIASDNRGQGGTVNRRGKVCGGAWGKSFKNKIRKLSEEALEWLGMDWDKTGGENP